MRSVGILITAVAAFAAFDGCAPDAIAKNIRKTIRLAQTSNVTNCMMTCNAQAATCRVGCLTPGTALGGASTTTANANTNTACQVNCSTAQLTCQTTCAQTSPSQ